MTLERYSSDTVQIHFGDVLEVLKTSVADESLDLIFADPPYNIGKKFGTFRDSWETEAAYISWCFSWVDLCLQKLKDTGSFYLSCSTQAQPYLDLHLRTKSTILSRIVWHYDSSGVQAKRYFGSLYEPILFAVKNPKTYKFRSEAILVEAPTGAQRKLVDYRKKVPQVYNTKKVPGNVWYIPRVRYKMPEYENHPTQKPEKLLERIILASTDVGDTVLDPFSGTFTTCAVAQRLGRFSVGIENQKEYLKVGLRRLGICDVFEGEVLRRMS